MRMTALALVGTMLALLWSGAAGAACQGTDLIGELSAADRARLEDRARLHHHAEGNLWLAERGAERVVLVGTYHLADARHAQMMARVAPWLDGARSLLVEAGPEEEARLKESLLQRPEFMFILDGPTLPEMLEDAEWQHLVAEMRSRGIPAFMASKMQPWYTAMLLGIPACALESVRAGAKGLDNLLIEAATGAGLPVVALEPFDTLFALFDDLAQGDALDMIRISLLWAARPEDMTVTLANAYFREQSRLIWEFARDQAMATQAGDADADRQIALLEEVLMTRRNRAWMPVILEASQEGPVVAAFGALHLSGEDGVLRLLEDEGFTLRRLE